MREIWRVPALRNPYAAVKWGLSMVLSRHDDWERVVVEVELGERTWVVSAYEDR